MRSPLSSIGRLTDEVQAWMRTKGLEGCHVAGNSTGGGVALELAARGAVASAVAAVTAAAPATAAAGAAAIVAGRGRERDAIARRWR